MNVHNSGKLYHTLKLTLNNNLIKIIQQYTINVCKKELIFPELIRSTHTMKYQLNDSWKYDGYNNFKLNSVKGLSDEIRWYLYTNE